MGNVASVRKDLVIQAAQKTAFRVFTADIGRWWPRAHHAGVSPLKTVVLPASADGRWYSICEDGSEAQIGKVLVWDPPKRIILAWQINATWKYDPAFITEVEVTFSPDGPMATRIGFEHRDLHRYGIAAEAIRTKFDDEEGWSAILASFARAATMSGKN